MVAVIHVTERNEWRLSFTMHQQEAPSSQADEKAILTQMLQHTANGSYPAQSEGRLTQHSTNLL